MQDVIVYSVCFIPAILIATFMVISGLMKGKLIHQYLGNRHKKVILKSENPNIYWFTACVYFLVILTAVFIFINM